MKLITLKVIKNSYVAMVNLKTISRLARIELIKQLKLNRPLLNI